MNSWKPIDSAPKDGRAVLLRSAERLPVVGRWFSDGEFGYAGWIDGRDVSIRPAPTEWVPIPE